MFSELKWTEMGKFNLDDHYIYYCGQESLRRNGVALIVNKNPKCSIWVQFQKWQNDSKWLSEEALQTAEKSREVGKAKEKRKNKPIWMQSSKE